MNTGQPTPTNSSIFSPIEPLLVQIIAPTNLAPAGGFMTAMPNFLYCKYFRVKTGVKFNFQQAVAM